MIDMLIQMPGPVFLVYFTFLSTICIFIGWLWVQADGSTRYPLPEENRLTPFEIAALRDGRKGVIQTALFNLWNRNLITMTGKGAALQIRRVNSSSHRPENEIEELLYQFANIKRKPADFFLDPALLSRLDKHIKPINHTLERLHLRRTPNQRARAWFALWTTLFIILSLGGIKLYFEIASSYPVESLMIIVAILIIITLNVLTPDQKSQLGHQYQIRLAKQFERMKVEQHNEVDPTLQIAIFGIRALAGSAVFASFEQAFGKNAMKTTSDGRSVGGCGGGGGGCGGG